MLGRYTRRKRKESKNSKQYYKKRHRAQDVCVSVIIPNMVRATTQVSQNDVLNIIEDNTLRTPDGPIT